MPEKEILALHVLRLTYLPWTAKLPARVRIKSERFKQSITLSLNGDRMFDVAIAELQKRGFNLLGTGVGDACSYLISDTLEPLLK